MCIRDSVRDLDQLERCLMQRALEFLVTIPVTVGLLHHDVALEQEAPVSYTHLRAHETVLDLVCRLLLEKKKQHIHVTEIHM